MKKKSITNKQKGKTKQKPHCTEYSPTVAIFNRPSLFFDEGSNSSNKQNNYNMHDSPVVPGDVSFESIMPLPVDVLSRLMSLQDEGSLSKRESPSDRPNVLNGDISP